jgi:hypothetical protein
MLPGSCAASRQNGIVNDKRHPLGTTVGSDGPNDTGWGRREPVLRGGRSRISAAHGLSTTGRVKLLLLARGPA